MSQHIESLLLAKASGKSLAGKAISKSLKICVLFPVFYTAKGVIKVIKVIKEIKYHNLCSWLCNRNLYSWKILWYYTSFEVVTSYFLILTLKTGDWSFWVKLIATVLPGGTMPNSQFNWKLAVIEKSKTNWQLVYGCQK